MSFDRPSLSHMPRKVDSFALNPKTESTAQGEWVEGVVANLRCANAATCTANKPGLQILVSRADTETS